MENQSNGYDVALDKAGDEFTTVYWVFDTLEQAQSFLQQLKNGCTGYDITLTIRDSFNNQIESWKLGDEMTPATKL